MGSSNLNLVPVTGQNISNISADMQLRDKGAFTNKQLELFQTFLANTDAERDAASNLFDFWDSLPRYSISQKQMNKMRDVKGRLDLLELPFNHRSISYRVIIQPAWIEEVVNGVSVTNYYYPSANEELIEIVLRKFANIQNRGYHLSNKRSGVFFTPYEIRKELKLQKHARTIADIIKSLKILSRAVIELRGQYKQNFLTKTNTYISNLTSVSPSESEENPESKWYADFHPLVTDAIDRIEYRQYDYKKLMAHSTQLARWIQTYITNKYVFASMLNPFTICYSTIKRESSMLSGYSHERSAVAAVDVSFQELESQDICKISERVVKKGSRGRIIEVTYKIVPTPSFVKEVKAANKRIKEDSRKL